MPKKMISKKLLKQKTKQAAEKKHEIEIDLSYIGSNEEAADVRTLASRQRLHEQMSTEVAEFLAKGGKIKQIERDLMTDPPKKPVSHYGQNPI